MAVFYSVLYTFKEGQKSETTITAWFAQNALLPAGSALGLKRRRGQSPDYPGGQSLGAGKCSPIVCRAGELLATQAWFGHSVIPSGGGTSSIGLRSQQSGLGHKVVVILVTGLFSGSVFLKRAMGTQLAGRLPTLSPFFALFFLPHFFRSFCSASLIVLSQSFSLLSLAGTPGLMRSRADNVAGEWIQ